jgi:hypothetical protein
VQQQMQTLQQMQMQHSHPQVGGVPSSNEPARLVLNLLAPAVSPTQAASLGPSISGSLGMQGGLRLSQPLHIAPPFQPPLLAAASALRVGGGPLGPLGGLNAPRPPVLAPPVYAVLKRRRGSGRPVGVKVPWQSCPQPRPLAGVSGI